MLSNKIQKFVSSVLIGIVTTQPLVSAAAEYRIPLKVRTAPLLPGAGDGIVDVGENPTPAKLTLSPSVLQFDMTDGARETHTSLLTNSGYSATAVTGIASNGDFTVSHNCPATLAPGANCVLSATPTSSAPLGARYEMPVLAPTALAPEFLGLTTDGQVGDDPSPRLSVDNQLVNAGTLLEPGARGYGSAVLRNRGNAPATLGGLRSSKEFVVSSDCPAVLPAGGNCTISTVFSSNTPKNYSIPLTLAAEGTKNVTYLTFYASVKNDPAKLPALAFDTNQLSFGPLEVGASETKTATLRNTGSEPAVLAPFASTADFAVQSECPEPLPIGGQCVVSVTFKALAAGTMPGHLLVAQSQDNVKAQMFNQGHVSGTPSQEPASDLVFMPEGLAFGDVAAGQVSSLHATLTNKGQIAAALQSVAVDFGNDVFTQSNDCGAQLAPNGSCTLTVSFKTDSGGYRNGRVNVLPTKGHSAVLGLSANSIKATLLAGPNPLQLGAIALPGSSEVFTVGLGNGGNIPVTGLALHNNDARLAIGYGNCSDTLVPYTGCTLTVKYTPDADGPIETSFQVTSSNGGAATVKVVGSAVKLAVSPATLTFPVTRVGAVSPTQSVTVTNVGQASAALSKLYMTAPQFSQTNNCGASLAAGASCTAVVRYAPSGLEPNSVVAQQGALRVVAGGKDVAEASLTGTGEYPSLVLSPRAVRAPSTIVGQSAAPVRVTVSNPTSLSVDVTGTGIVTGGEDFAQSNNCGTTLAPGGSCLVNIQFTPTASGERNGNWSATTSLGTYTMGLNGSGLLILTVSPGSLDFPSINLGKSSDVQALTITNPTPQAANLSGPGMGMSISGGAGDFGQTNNCGTQLAAGASCQASLKFTPSAAGDRQGSWSVVSSFGPSFVWLNGKGTKPNGSIDESNNNVTPSKDPVSDGFKHYTITFLDTEVSMSSAVRDVKFTNKGDGPLGIQGISILNGDTDFSQSNNCGAVLPAGTFCTISLLFTPSALGARTGNVVLLSETGNYSFDMSAKGVGAAGQWKPDTTADFGDVAVGTTAQRSFTLLNTGTLPAKMVSTSLEGETLTVVSNACGTADAPISIAAGGSCKVTVKYSPTAPGKLTSATLTATGRLANGPVKFSLSGNAPTPVLAFDATPTGDYGTTTVGATASRTFTLRNAGKSTDKLASTPTVTGSGFTLTDGTCVQGMSLAINATCTITVAVTPGSTGAATGSIAAVSTQGAQTQLALTSNAIQSEYTVSGAAGSNSAPVTDFGNASVGTTTPVVNYFYLRDNANLATVVTNLVSLRGDTSFAITDIRVVNSAGTAVVVCSTSATASTGQCSAAASSRAIRIAVQFAPASVGAKAAVLRLEHNGSQGVSEVQLTGAGVFNATGAWSTSMGSTAAPTAADLTYGTKTEGATAVDKTFYIRNVGTNGGEAVGFVLSGDVGKFQLVNVQKAGVVRTMYGPANATATCAPSGTIGADKLSAEPCQADDIANAGNYPHIAVTVRFTPTNLGDFSVTVTPITNNGTRLPAPITLTGSVKFSSAGAWSNNVATTIAPTTTDLNYGVKTTGAAPVERVFFVRNVGTNGGQAVGFNLSGDTDYFKIVSVQKAAVRNGMWGGSYPEYAACSAGGVVSANAKSATPCLGDDVAVAGSFTHVAVTVRFTPTTAGTYNVTVSPSTNNGTVLPGTVTLSGTVQFNPQGVWSNNVATTVAPTAADKDYGTKTAGAAAVTKTFYMRNIGTYGGEAVGFALSGDVSQFQIVSVQKSYSQPGTWGGYSPVSTTCESGGTVAAGNLSATPCQANDIATGGYPHVAVTVRFTPTAVGTYSVTVAPTTNNGTILPAAMALQGVVQ